jgi:hypothetical protein
MLPEAERPTKGEGFAFEAEGKRQEAELRESNLTDLNMVRETQVSLLTYNHILQGRYLDVVALITHKYLVSDLRNEITTTFSMLGCGSKERLDTFMENDPVAMENRNKCLNTIEKLGNALKKLERCE